ncbi:hypothetical protein E8E12_004388 [Didymella heteroderae]|uniref:AB hydrolase-1 domain-containing protein n=1 Tax=Didymella heteroderae TaxID=1769908 RepID=A0A9P4WJ72_9PLEO|nr:hypothetical protein E8E12_004388 [Didymella heteroderae]
MASMILLVKVLAISSIIVSSLAVTAKQVLILVPGAFHRASVYDEVKAQLVDLGFEHIDAVDMPSVGNNVADVEQTADVNVVNGLLEARLSNGQDIILVGNSYGATVIMEAVKDFEDRSVVSAPGITEGEGKVLGLIMLSDYIPTIAEVTQNPPRPDIRGIGAPFFNYHLAANDTPTIVTWGSNLVNYPPRHTFYNL